MLNRFLRTAPTRTLLGAITGIVIVIVGGTAIALAAQGSGPVPNARPPLAVAVHNAMAAPQVQGFSADISFTNGLIDTSELQGSDPLLQGGSGHVWISNTGQIRVELYGDNGDPELVASNGRWWISDPTLQTVYEGKLPAQSAAKRHTRSQTGKLPTVAQIQADINRLAQHLHISGAAPTDVGGQATYTVSVSPKQAGGLVGKLQLAWDALKGVPLRFAVYARGSSKPALELAASNISYGPVSGVFDLTPPSGYRVVNVATPTGSSSARATRTKKAGKRAEITGVTAVAKHLGFKLAAPATLAGMQRESVSLMGKGALVTYGQGLGGLAVMEEPATAASSQQLQLSHGAGDHQDGITLPTFSVRGTTAQELDTALGTFVRYSSGGVTYTVIGSVAPHVARSAARGL